MMGITASIVANTIESTQPNKILLILSVIIAISAVIFSTVSSFMIRKRIYYASRFGKSEHVFGRVLGILIILTFFLEFLHLGYTLLGIILCFLAWAIYLVSHTLEKLFYGHHGPRG